MHASSFVLRTELKASCASEMKCIRFYWLVCKANSNPPSHPSRNNEQVSCFWTQPNFLMLLEEGFGLLGYQDYLFGNYLVQSVSWNWAGFGNWIWMQSSGSAVTSPAPGSSLYTWNGMVLNNVLMLYKFVLLPLALQALEMQATTAGLNSLWFCTASQKWIQCHVNMTMEALLSNSFNEYWHRIRAN